MSRLAPAMTDARAFTNYVSPGAYNEFVMARFGLADSNAYRAFLCGADSERVRRLSASLKSFDTDSRWSAPPPPPPPPHAP